MAPCITSAPMAPRSQISTGGTGKSDVEAPRGEILGSVGVMESEALGGGGVSKGRCAARRPRVGNWRELVGFGNQNHGGNGENYQAFLEILHASKITLDFSSVPPIL